MNLLENIMTWCVLALAIAGTVTFASVLHEELVDRRRRKRDSKKMPTPVHTSCTEEKLDDPLPLTHLVRGYDSHELFREDLWLRRLNLARQEFALLEAPTPLSKIRVRNPRDYGRRVCAMLAQHAGTRCDN